jgi:subtilisin family serine protease
MVILWVSQILLDYYTTLTTKDAAGTPIHFGAQAKIGGGQIANYSGQGQQVALFSSRGPDVKDFNFNQADVLKPNVLAPGYLIWGAWTPIGIDNPNYMGQRWAMISGTSMATPHAAGLAALLKEKYPLWSPAALASAMTTTADVNDSRGFPLQAQEISGGSAPLLQAATPFDMGGGALNINAALNPGIIFDAGQ